MVTQKTDPIATRDRVPFFIVGSARSGTTLFRLMLNEHPRLRVPRETHFLSDLLDVLPTDRPLTAAEVERAGAIVTGHPRWAQWGADAAALRSVLASLDRPLLRDVVDALFREVNNPEDKPRWGDKTPVYVREIVRLHRLFPEAQFLHVVRDGRDVCVSLRERGWWGRHVLKWGYYWDKSIRLGREAGQALGPARYMEVRYEDLVLSTEDTLRRVCAFLGEAYTPCMLEYHARAAEEVDPSERGVHAKTRRLPRPADVSRWPRELGTVHTICFEIMAGETMDLLGQERRFPRLKVLSRLTAAGRRTLGPRVRPLRDALVARVPVLRHYL